PLTEICLKQHTIAQWFGIQIAQSQEKADSLAKQIQSLKQENSADTSQISVLKKQLLLEEKSGNFYRRMQPFVEKYTPHTLFKTVVFLMLVLLIGTVLKLIFIFLHSYLSSWIAQNAAFNIREEFFRKVLDYEIGYFNSEGVDRVADVMSRFTNDMFSLTDGLKILYGKIVREPLKMLVCIAGAAYVSWQLLLLVLLLVPSAAYCIRWLAKSIKRVVSNWMVETAVLYSQLEESFHSIRIVKVFSREPYERAKFRRVNRAYRHKSIKIAKYDSLAQPLIEFFGILMICLAIIAGAYLALGGQTAISGIQMLYSPLDIGSLILFFAFLAGAADPARKLSDIFTQFQSAAAAADRVYALIDRIPEIREPQRDRKLLPPSIHRPNIIFDDVSFSYEPDRPVLQNVSLEIPFSECLAVVGTTGCGKSTLLNMIPRFFDPSSGQIRLGRVPLTSLRFRELRQQIGMVTQDSILFNDTVINNILYGSRTAKREDAIEAAKKAFAHEFITDLSSGYDTVVGPAGGQLSGGQRQRIALARAILRNPQVLLLDEATSQIDGSSEKMIHQSLSEFKIGRTVIFITHRLSAIELADRIIVMDNGRIIAAGTHSDLLQSCPEYAKMY
ncbi:MAG: ABC transporter ATP-binding protein/permease, partial [Planctomycetaceae bacterium]|nr:ABC transporter ATP-binding protein/permease [Planctomycetaceae bacterium]